MKKEEERESKSQRTGRREYIPQESRAHRITLKKNSSEREMKEWLDGKNRLNLKVKRQIKSRKLEISYSVA